MKLIDYPKYMSVDVYEESITDMVNKLVSHPAVQSIYQIGGVSSPGISDIDLLIIFHDDAHCDLNPLSNITGSDRYLFIHNLYGLSESSFKQAQELPLFQDYRHLWGKNQNPTQYKPSGPVLNTQIGLEFLIKMFVTMTMERTYKIIKVRNLLLHVKALIIDAEYLGVTSGKFIDMINTVISWRSTWFKTEHSAKELKDWHEEFYIELKNFLETNVRPGMLYIPDWAELNIGRNLVLSPSPHFHYSHRGVVLPYVFGGLGRKYFNIQHRFNKFEFSMPITQNNIPAVLESRHELYTQLGELNAKQYPYFIPVVYGLPVYRRRRQV